MERIKEFESILRNWFLENTRNEVLIDFILNYCLKEDFKKIEEEIRNKFGKEI